MKQFYFSILFLSFTFFISAQTNPTGSSTETGVTTGDLAVTLSGGASYNVPIAVPPGINGIVPEISLSYNSQGGPGLSGYGWDISGISKITRIPKTKFHDNEIDAVDYVDDHFALDGQRLVVKKGTSGIYGANGTQYETENFSNIKITSYGVEALRPKAGPIYFLVEYPDGSKAYYGLQTNTATYIDWGITYWENPQGVNIKYVYGTSLRSITSIKYGTRGTSTPINEIKFIYEVRARKESFYMGGESYERHERLKEILCISNNTGFRNYTLDYTVSSQNYDQLSKITEKNGDKSKSYNPTVFQYNNTESNITYVPNPPALDVSSINSTNSATVPGDFDGDGNMDFILYPTTGSAAKTKYYLFTGISPSSGSKTFVNSAFPIASGSFDEIFPVSFLTWNTKYWYSKGWTVLKTDATTNVSTFSTYATTGSTLIYPQDTKQYTFPKLSYTFNNCSKTTTVEEVIPKFYLNGDFNGDGLTDIVLIEKTFTYNTKKCPIGNPTTATYAGGKSYFVNLDRRVTSSFANVSGTLPITAQSKCYVADFNGDGKSDIYIFDAGKVTVFSLNENNMLVQQPLTPFYNLDIKINKPIVIGDFNGDGKSDFMIHSATNNWIQCNATGTTFIEDYVINFSPYYTNDSRNTYHYYATDYDHDGKSDVTIIKNSEDTFSFRGTIQVSTITRTAQNTYITKTAITPQQDNIDIYALPILLPSSSKEVPRFEIAFVNNNRLHFFNSPKDASNDLLTSITAGNGVQEFITYQPLDQIYENDFYNIYTPSTITETYPYFDVVSSPNFQIVTKLEKKSGTVSKKKLYGYYGAVTHLEGLGFMGFRSIMETNWHDNNNTIISTVTNRNVKLRGAVTDSYVLPYLTYPYGGFSPSTFTSKTTLSYTPSTPEDALEANKVFKLQNTGGIQYNGLDNTSVTTTNAFDLNNYITSSTSVTKEGSTIAQTSTTTIGYQPVITSPLYILGRPIRKDQTLTTTGSPAITNTEVYTYNSNQLLSDIDKIATGTGTIKEHNDYDAFGNVIKKTITAPLPLQPRNTWYEYDLSGRFVTKITDNDLLESTFEYDNGLLKKKTNPYGLSTSYTYDTWFKPLTVKDDQLNKAVTTSYTNSYSSTGSQTTVITTTDALDGGSSIETFDDLGRKIKTGAKDINGVFSYVSFLYDIYDRNYKTSEPYFGSSPSQWNEKKFDLYSRPTETTLFNSRTTTTNYLGLVTTITDGLKTKTITKNAIGNVISSDETLGGTINYSYFSNGNLKQSNYNGISITTEQDGWGQKTGLIDPSTGTFRYDLNDFGELNEETSQNGNVKTTIIRDANGRPTKKTMTGPGTNSETTYTYDSAKLPLTIRYKDLNEPTGTNEILTTITYDAFKRQSIITEEKLGVSKFTKSLEYDGLGRIITETKTAELGGKTSTVVNKNVYKNGALYQILDINNKVLWQLNIVSAKGQSLESIMGNGIKMTNTYDTDGYLSKIQYDKTTQPATNILTLTTKFDKNTDNLLERINSSFGNYKEEFDYDELDRLKEFTNKHGVKETQNYDASGKITSNNLGTYDYDPSKKYQNTSITLTPETTGYYANREGIYNDSMESGTGWGAEKYPSTNFFSYDDTKVPHASGKNTLKLSNTTTTEQYLFSDKWIDIDNAVPTSYTYSAWVYSDGPQAQLFLFMEDGLHTITNDNVVTNITGSWTQMTKTFLVPAGVKRIRIRLDNNAQGNIWFDDVQIRKTSNAPTAERKLNVTYNAFNSPIQIEETGVDKISFTYNDNNQRSTMYYGSLEDKELRPLRKHYSADGSMEVKQNMTTGAIEFVTYIGGDGYSAPIAVKSDGINSADYLYLHRDYQGTILAITNDTGALVEKRLFDAWGNIIKVEDGAGNALNGLTVLDRGYTGHEHLQSVGLIHMNARLYDPLIHRFLQVDNYIQDPSNTQNYNSYGYVLNNPLKYTDPSGEKFKLTWNDVFAAVAVVVGVVLIAASTVTFGTTSIIGGSLVAGGLGHFASAYSEYQKTGNWASASNGAGFMFGIQFNTDWGYNNDKKNGIAQEQPSVKPIASDDVNMGSDGSNNLDFKAANNLDNNQPLITQYSEHLQPVFEYDAKGAVITGIGVSLAFLEDKMYNKQTWYSIKKMTTYNQSFNGNGYTGGKIASASRIANRFKWAGRTLGAYNAWSTYDAYSNGKINEYTLTVEQLSNIYSTFGGLNGAAWGIGWEGGRAITRIDAYQDWKQRIWLPYRKEKFGY